VKDFLAWIAPVLLVFGYFAGFGLFLAIVLASVEEVTVYTVIGRSATGFWRFCVGLGATVIPPPRRKPQRPSVGRLDAARGAFVEGRIDVAEFERRVADALREDPA
jgi:hypothetical protein